MNHLVLFENFSDHKYVWPDAGFWLEKLHPEELCFLAVCDNDGKFYDSKRKASF